MFRVAGVLWVLLCASVTIRLFNRWLIIPAKNFPDDAFVLPMIIRDICPDYNIIVSHEAHLYAFC